MSIDVNAIAIAMTEAARGVVAKRWPALRAVAEAELRTLAHTLDEVARMHAAGDIDSHRAQALVRMQQNTLLTALRGLEGVGIQSARQVTEAATRAAAAIVNRLVGVKLI